MSDALPADHLPGANNPPVDPFDAHMLHVDDLCVEAANWCDGADIENETQADEVDRLIDDFKDAIKATEISRDDEKKPYQARVTAIQERYYPILADTTKLKGKAIRAKAALLAVKSRWGVKQEAVAAAKAKALRDQANEDIRKAQEAAKAALGDLGATESAEDAIRAAQGASRAAAQAEKAKPVSGMRTYTVVEVADAVVALRTMWKMHPEEMLKFAKTLAERDVRDGRRTIDGFKITEERRAV